MDFTCDDIAKEGIANVADCKEAANLMIHDFTFVSDLPSPDIPRGCFYGFIEQYNSYPVLYLVWNNHHLGQRCQGGGYPFYSNCRSICSAVGRCRYSYIIIIIINVKLKGTKFYNLSKICKIYVLRRSRATISTKRRVYPEHD